LRPSLSALKGKIMDAKKLLTITIISLILLSLSGGTLVFSGPTSISGTMSCYMPTLLEMNAQSASPEVQEGMALKQTTFRGQTPVVTVCAK
jgi:hypothetical protein